jgi:formylmethanofuran dehydrogenase subunit A
MAGEKYGDRAVNALATYVESNLSMYLSAVEVAQSLVTGSMTQPAAYIASMIANDPRTPVVMVDCDGGGAENWGDNIHTYGCHVVLAFSGDADVVAGEAKARRYMTALIDCIRADATLGSTVEYAEGTAQDFDAEIDGDKMTRHAIRLIVMVRIHEP